MEERISINNNKLSRLETMIKAHEKTTNNNSSI